MERGAQIRKWFRIIHRELSYVFAGMLLVYAISGIALNHKATFNSSYRIERTEHQLPAEGTVSSRSAACPERRSSTTTPTRTLSRSFSKATVR